MAYRLNVWAALAVSVVGAGCSNSSPNAGANGAAPVSYRVGVNRSAKSLLDENGKLTGLYIDVFQAAAARAGIVFDFVWLEDRSLDQAFLDKQIDLHVAVADTSSRRALPIYLADPWWESPLVAVVSRTSPYKRLEDLRGKPVAVAPGAKRFWDMFFGASVPGALRVDAPALSTAVEVMCRGEAAAVLVVGPDAENMLASHPAVCRDIGFRFLRVGVEKVRYSLGSQLEYRAVCERLNAEIREMAVDGTLAHTVSPWLGLNSAAADGLGQAIIARRRQQLTLTLAAMTGILLISLLLGFLLWNERRTSRRVAKALERARRGEEVKTQFLATMSHEIRTPLNGVLGMSEVMLTTGLNPQQRDAALTIRRSSEALLTVLNDILDLAKFEAGQVSLVREPFVLRPLLDDVATLLAVRAAEKGLSLYIDVAPAVPDGLVGDPGRLRQILLNLAGNAVKFTESGSVYLRVTQEAPAGGPALPQKLRFTVQDTGPGIPPEKAPLLFQKFTQLDGSAGRRHGGAGLGLAISKRLVEAMGGRIELDSLFGQGATFWFALPFDLLEARSRPEPLPLSGRTVRIDGADAEQVRCLRQLAAASGARLAENGSAADASVWVGAADAAQARGAARALTGTVSLAALIDALGGPAVAPQDSRPTGSSTALTLQFAGKRVLVAEDNLVNRRLLVALLSKLQCDVLEAQNGLEAVSLWRAERPELVMMDCQMPEMDGYDAARLIRAEEEEQHLDPAAKETAARTKIWAVTANVMPEDQARCLASGMDNILPKPFTLAHLTAALSQAFEPTCSPSR